MSQPSFVLRLNSDRPADAERLDEASQSLRSDLLNINGVATVVPVGTESPEGAKSAVSLALASLSVTAATGVGAHVVGANIARVTLGWLQRNSGKRVTVTIPGRGEIDLTGFSMAEAAKLMESALAASADGAPLVDKDPEPQQ
jgi:hypothetical protein